MQSYKVYKHTTPSGKVYIGITSLSIRRRKSSGYANNAHFLRAIKKYGWDNITTEILFDGLSREEACRLEMSLIEQHRSNDERFGYNLSSGGESHSGCNFKHTEETKRRISEHNSRHWLGTKGAHFGKTKLNEEDVNYIRTNYKRGSKDFNLGFFAKKFGVSEVVISRVVNNKYPR